MGISADLPNDLADMLRFTARERGVSEAEVLRDLLVGEGFNCASVFATSKADGKIRVRVIPGT